MDNFEAAGCSPCQSRCRVSERQAAEQHNNWEHRAVALRCSCLPAPKALPACAGKQQQAPRPAPTQPCSSGSRTLVRRAAPSSTAHGHLRGDSPTSRPAAPRLASGPAAAGWRAAGAGMRGVGLATRGNAAAKRKADRVRLDGTKLPGFGVVCEARGSNPCTRAFMISVGCPV
jgi:hypothetical protein